MRTIAEVESLFEREDRESAAALGEGFLLGYLAQRQDFYTRHSASNQQEEDKATYRFGTDRASALAWLAAVADYVERYATLEKRGERTVSAHEGNTAALRGMVQLTRSPLLRGRRSTPSCCRIGKSSEFAQAPTPSLCCKPSRADLSAKQGLTTRR